LDLPVQDETLLTIALSAVTKPFNTLKNGNVMGQVCRMIADETVPLYDTPGEKSPVMLRLKPGVLLVAYSDPGEMRQINTADQMFGYIRRSVKLVPVEGLTPDELYNHPQKRAAFEAQLPPLQGLAPATEQAERKKKLGQNLFMAGFVLLILLGFLLVLTRPPKEPASDQKAAVVKQP
jgi:hypothetical protein